MPERLHVLLIEDNAGDARYIQELLEEAQEFTTRSIEHGGRLVGDDAGRRADSGAGRRGSDGVVSTGAFVHETRLDDGLARLDERSFDVVLLDLNLPDSTGIDTVRTLLDHEDLVPVVVLTGLRDRETGIEALREGADEYLVKDEINPDLLIRSVIHAIERKAHEREQRRYETLVPPRGWSVVRSGDTADVVCGESARTIPPMGMAPDEGCLLHIGHVMAR